MTKKSFEDFDFKAFWDNCDYALKSYVSELPSDDLIHSIEKELGYKLPQSYIEMMKIQNGGIPFDCCFPTEENTSWAEDHVAIAGLYGIGREKDYSLCGDLGSQFMIDEWGYPPIGVCICDCPSGGHDLIMLDYRKCGKDGEPEVIHVDQEGDYHITFLAKDFETFIRGLVNEEIYDTSKEDYEENLNTIKTGNFSTLLSELMVAQKEIDFDTILRNILTALVEDKGYFSLHADEYSYLVYDIQFYLYTSQNKVSSMEQYLEVYPNMIVFGDAEIRTGGYAPAFLTDWAEVRLKKEIVEAEGFRFSAEYSSWLVEIIKPFLKGSSTKGFK